MTVTDVLASAWAHFSTSVPRICSTDPSLIPKRPPSGGPHLLILLADLMVPLGRGGVSEGRWRPAWRCCLSQRAEGQQGRCGGGACAIPRAEDRHNPPVCLRSQRRFTLVGGKTRGLNWQTRVHVRFLRRAGGGASRAARHACSTSVPGREGVAFQERLASSEGRGSSQMGASSTLPTACWYTGRVPLSRPATPREAPLFLCQGGLRGAGPQQHALR